MYDQVSELDVISTDSHVIEAGSDANKLSKYATSYDPEVAANDLSYN